MSKAPLPLIPWEKIFPSGEPRCVHVSQAVQEVALDLFILGFPSQANRLLSTLHETMNGLTFHHRETELAIYNAWEGSGSTPDWITNPSPEKTIVGFWWNDGKWSWNSEEKEQTLGNDWRYALPEKGQNVTELAQQASEYLTKHKRAQENIGNGQIISQGDEIDIDRIYMTLDVVVQIFVEQGDEKSARDVLGIRIPQIYRQIRQRIIEKFPTEKDQLRRHITARTGEGKAPAMWKINDHIEALHKSLHIDAESIETYVDDGIDRVERLFSKGESSPYVGKPIAGLIRILDESYVTARKVPTYEGPGMLVEKKDIENLTTFLRSPATDDEIAELEKKLARPADNEDEAAGAVHAFQFPEDYKEFLRITNGFYSGDQPTGQTSIFHGHAGVDRSAEDVIGGYDYTLFPNLIDIDDNVTDVPLDFPHCVTIGAGGDEGYICLIEPESVRETLAEFEKAYAEAGVREKRMYEFAAMDLYGGVEKLRETEWMVVVVYHWDTNQYIYGGFREYLEREAVPFAVRQGKEAAEEAEKLARKKKRYYDGNAPEDSALQGDDNYGRAGWSKLEDEFYKEPVSDWDEDQWESGDLQPVPIRLGGTRNFLIGEGPHENDLIFSIEPQNVASLLRIFEEYAQARERKNTVYRLAALDLYGDLEKLREVKWLVLVF
ncbi:hypothetical protein BS50DRAFT_680715 [Corynespora cassiicola Philippines]|uniref:Knr4/Smi1-like domain-containing protein n=1 Tax=Corynespora cassiicola Philippines TaxID=1448308 RepID=A0A2T2N8P6_CORCC|nr:hypothetical protein BS50DRAFT_680715 [Corynespora cassiicola Philippines]